MLENIFNFPNSDISELRSPADPEKFQDELEFLAMCEIGHEERLENSFHNDFNHKIGE